MKIKKKVIVFFKLLPFVNLGIENLRTLLDKERVGGIMFHKHYFWFDLFPYVPSTIFQLCRNGSSWVEVRRDLHYALTQNENFT